MRMSELAIFEMASLLSSRLCHDLVSPVGAVTNGLEVLEDEDDAEMREMAFRLIRESAERTANKLQFARLAYGAAGGPGADIDLGEARKVCTQILGDHKVTLDWQCDLAAVDRLIAKLFVNLIYLCAESLPRGGSVAAQLSVQGSGAEIVVKGEGAMLRPAEGTAQVLGGERELNGLSPRAAQAYYTGLVARCLNAKVDMVERDELLSFVCHTQL